MKCADLSVRPFDWTCWQALWVVRIRLLAEAGINVDPGSIPGAPENVGRDHPEWDFHHIRSVYLTGSGGFWLAWHGDSPAGYVGAQDLGPLVELRRMYVCPEYRRLGLGVRLARALINHCQTRGVAAVALDRWERPRPAAVREDGLSSSRAPGPECGSDRR